MAAIFVPLSEEDPSLELVTILDELNGKNVEEAKAVAHPKLIQQVFAQIDKVMAADENTINVVWNLTFSILLKAPAADLPALVDKAIKAFTDTPAKSPQLKLRLLTNLYNLLPSDSSLKFVSFNALATFALDINANNTLINLVPQLRQIPTLSLAWNLTPTQQSSFYLLAHKVCLAVKHSNSQYYLVEFLKTIKAGGKEVEQAKPYAVTAVINVLKLSNPPVAQLDALFDLIVVKSLAKDKKFGQVYDLLSIFVQEQVGAYNKFIKDKNNASWVKQEIGEVEIVYTKIRSLSLCSLAAKKDKLTYKEIAIALEIKQEEVENAVIEAVMNGVIEARMDEENECVHVSRYAQRHFDSWELLGERLNQWRTNVQNVLNTLHQFPAQAAGGGAGAGGEAEQQYED